MTIKDILNQSGNGGIKAAFERLHHGSHGYYGGGSGGGGYNYQQAPTFHGSPHVFKHYSYSHSEGGGKGGASKGGAALSALTLLSFLFFLNILQQCLKDQMAAMNPQVMVMTSGREDIRASVKSVEGKEDKPTSEEQSEYAVGDGIGRAYPAEPMEKLLAEKKETAENDEHSIDKHATQFVDAMGDGIGEVISEQK